MWNRNTCECKCNKACKIDEYIDTKNCSCEKRLIGKLVLESENETLNTTESSLDNKKGTREESNSLIHTISLAIIFLLLLTAVSTGCYYYYAINWIKKDCILSY